MRIASCFIVFTLLLSCIPTGCDDGGFNTMQHVVRQESLRLPDAPNQLTVTGERVSVDLRVDRGRDVATVEAEFWIDHDSMTTASNRLKASSLQHEVDGNRLVLTPTLQPDVGVHLTIVMPDVQGATIQTESGPIRVQGASGELNVTSGSGSVKVYEQAGMVAVVASSGAITIENCTGTLELHTQNGAITVTHATSDVRARTANGAITLSVQLDQTPSLQLFTDSGAIDVTVGTVFTGEVDLVTDNGSITVNDEPKIITAEVHDDEGNRHLVIGAGYNKSTLRTQNGSVTFTVSPGPPTDDPAG